MPRAIALLLGLAVATVASAVVLAPMDSPRWSSRYDPHFRKYTKRYFGPHFDWRWFKAQGIVESRLHPTIVSPAGAIGVMQILPTTFEEIREANPHYLDIRTPRWNIAAGIYYDRYLSRKPAWDRLADEERLMLAFAGYNAGLGGALRAWRRAPEGAVRWEQIAPHAPRETRGYVAQIRSLILPGDRPLPRERGASRLIARQDR